MKINNSDNKKRQQRENSNESNLFLRFSSLVTCLFIYLKYKGTNLLMTWLKRINIEKEKTITVDQHLSLKFS